MTTVGLALGSGSARGLAHIGVLKALEKAGIQVDLIAGTSIGALIGGAYATGMTPGEMERIALEVDVRRLVSLVDIAKPTTALVNGRHVERFIREVVDDKTFEDTDIPFTCVAVDVAARELVLMSQGDLGTAIRASISTPVIFAPVEREGRWLVDGGVLNSVPADVARGMGADIVVAVTNLGIPSGDMPVFSASGSRLEGAAAGRDKSSLRESLYSGVLTGVMGKLRSPSVVQLAFDSIDLMQRELSEPHLRAADVVIAPRIDDAAYYNFNNARHMIAVGERAAEAAIDEIVQVRLR